MSACATTTAVQTEVCNVCKGGRDDCRRCHGAGVLPIAGLEIGERGFSAFTLDVVDRTMATHRTARLELFTNRRACLLDLLDAAKSFAESVDDVTLEPGTRRASVRELVQAAEQWMKSKAPPGVKHG